MTSSHSWEMKLQALLHCYSASLCSCNPDMVEVAFRATLSHEMFWAAIFFFIRRWLTLKVVIKQTKRRCDKEKMKQTNLVDQNMCKKGQEKIARKSDRFFKNKNESSVVVPIYPEK